MMNNIQDYDNIITNNNFNKIESNQKAIDLIIKLL